MSKSVILITIAGTLWVATGSALAQSSKASRTPAAGNAQSAVNGLPITIPSVSALNRPLAVPVGRVPDLVVAPPGLAVAAANFAATAPGRIGAVPGLSGTAPGGVGTVPGHFGIAPGLAGKSLEQEKSAKESDSSRGVKEASLSGAVQRKELHQVPTCN
jgi:hypothetical protein